MKLLPQRKTLVGYARKLNKAHSRVQLDILQTSYTDRLEHGEIEVLDYLCHYKRIQLEAEASLHVLAAETQRAKTPTLADVKDFVSRGLRAQQAIDALGCGVRVPSILAPAAPRRVVR